MNAFYRRGNITRRRSCPYCYCGPSPWLLFLVVVRIGSFICIKYIARRKGPESISGFGPFHFLRTPPCRRQEALRLIRNQR